MIRKEGITMNKMSNENMNNPSQPSSVKAANPVSVESYLKGIDYPASKDDLIEKAKQNNAPEEVIQTLQQFSQGQYSSPIDVSKEVGSMH